MSTRLNARTSAAQFEAMARQAIASSRARRRRRRRGRDRAVFSLGRLYLRTGDATKAIDAFDRVVTQNPGSVQGAPVAGAGVCGRGRSEERHRNARRHRGRRAARGVHAGAVSGAGGTADTEAVESYTRALAIEPTNRALKFRRIAALFNAKDYERAAVVRGRGAGAARRRPAVPSDPGPGALRDRRHVPRALSDPRADGQGSFHATRPRSWRSPTCIKTPDDLPTPSARSGNCWSVEPGQRRRR